ncbi:carbohydrate binding protein with CBM25 domain [Luteimicrobium subarcticum]|uniref:Carbohydrate binding protein with CBM25 domain n=1 Tax=Luteimicrobium subarcticum TaxID=620910 RepID=A0A2M8WRU5_9MICO|nr:carbohydrate binding protein with CBM25 domain [Luteimicrobium subarcticum]
MKGWSTYDIHHQVGTGAWTTAPGVPMSAACAGWVSKTIDLGTATTLTATFTDGNGTWDDNGSKNDALRSGVSAVKDGVVTTTDPCASSPTATSSPTSAPTSTATSGTTLGDAWRG